jgi:hypothetical protein
MDISHEEYHSHFVPTVSIDKVNAKKQLEPCKMPQESAMYTSLRMGNLHSVEAACTRFSETFSFEEASDGPQGAACDDQVHCISADTHHVRISADAISSLRRMPRRLELAAGLRLRHSSLWDKGKSSGMMMMHSTDTRIKATLRSLGRHAMISGIQCIGMAVLERLALSGKRRAVETIVAEKGIEAGE